MVVTADCVCNPLKTYISYSFNCTDKWDGILKKQNWVYLQLCDHVYATKFNKSIILLDVIKDQYTILDDEVGKYFHIIINSAFELRGKLYIPLKANVDVVRLNEYIETFRKSSVLMLSHFSYPCKKGLTEKNSCGIRDIIWRIDRKFLQIKTPILLVIKAYLYLCYTNLLLSFFGFYSLVKVIRKRFFTKKLSNNIPQKKLVKIISSLHKASLYFPINTKCLEFASTLALILYTEGVKCRLQIGVQTIPFVAHAWVSYNGRVLADKQIYQDKLAIILSEPTIK